MIQSTRSVRIGHPHRRELSGKNIGRCSLLQGLPLVDSDYLCAQGH